jgi:broad specificity phosphatase PhoE
MRSHLILVRHGETEWNHLKRYQGSIDIPLNEAGVLGAVELAKTLASVPISAIYTSPLSRAHATAQIIAKDHALAPTTHHELREWSFGSLEGKTAQEIQELCAAELAFASSLHSTERIKHKLVPDQESGIEVVLRVLPCLQDIAKNHLGQTALVVTHGGVIRALLIHFAKLSWDQTHIPNCNGASFLSDGQSFALQDFPLYN